MAGRPFDDAFFARMRDRLDSEFDWYGMDEENTVECLRLAFEFAQSPPKPDEPTGLGAVVEDADGIRWTRVEDESNSTSHDPWYPADCNEQPREFAEIAAVKVLSEGVVLP